LPPFSDRESSEGRQGLYRLSFWVEKEKEKKLTARNNVTWLVASQNYDDEACDLAVLQWCGRIHDEVSGVKII
jgi:hypothetical protein